MPCNLILDRRAQCPGCIASVNCSFHLPLLLSQFSPYLFPLPLLSLLSHSKPYLFSSLIVQRHFPLFFLPFFLYLSPPLSLSPLLLNSLSLLSLMPLNINLSAILCFKGTAVYVHDRQEEERKRREEEEERARERERQIQYNQHDYSRQHFPTYGAGYRH